MPRRLESQCTCTGGSDGARESEEVKVKGGKREGERYMYMTTGGQERGSEGGRGREGGRVEVREGGWK